MDTDYTKRPVQPKTKFYEKQLIPVIFTVIFVLIYLFPMGKINAYIPYYMIGLLFILLFVQNGMKITIRHTFLWVTVYGLLANFFIATAVFDYSFAWAIKTSLFFLVPFMSVCIGVVLANRYPHLKWNYILFVILLAELIVCLLQSYGGSRGYYLISLFGSEKYTSSYYIAGTDKRALGTFGNPNLCGVGCAILALLLLNGNRNRAIRLAVLAMTAVIILLTKSRTSLVVFLLVLFLNYTKLFDKKVSLFKRAVGVAASVLFMAVAYYLFVKYVDRDISVAAMEDRFTIWRNLLANSYTTNVEKTVGKLFGLGVTRLKALEDCDNEYLYFYMSTGIIGSLIMIAEIVSVALASFRIEDQADRIVCLSLIAVWFMVAISSNFFTSYMLAFVSFLYIGFALAKAAALRKQGEIHEKDPDR